MTLTLNRQLLTSRQILVAFSGGLDSTVLLHQLVQWRTENPGVALRAIHVHHGLSANADTGYALRKRLPTVAGAAGGRAPACNLRKKDWALRLVRGRRVIRHICPHLVAR